MAYDIIYSGKFYFEGAFQDLEVAVRDGRIANISKSITGGRKVRLEGAVLPAGTDTHVHFRDPGETDKEDFASGSTAALYGGTTTVYDMPNNRIPISDYSLFEDKLASVSSRAFCDFGLYSLYNGKNADVISRKSSGLKIYLGGSTNAVAVGKLRQGDTEKLNEMDIPVVFHGEDPECMKYNAIPEENTLGDHDRARPEECETKAADTITGLGIRRGVMAHISSSRTLDHLVDGVIREVTPHHLLLNSDMDVNAWRKVNPPLRERRTQESLLSAFLAGKMDVLSSDHAPHTEHDKEEFYQAASGIIGVETRLPLMLALVQNKILTLERLYQVAIVNPARLMNLKKGQIEMDYFADFIALRFSAVRRINQERLHSKTPISPFHGFPAVFPEPVVMRGEIVIDGEEVIEDNRGLHVGALEAVKD